MTAKQKKDVVSRPNSKWRYVHPEPVAFSAQSLVVPNQALTIPQILQRYVNGQAVPDRSRNLTYNESEMPFLHRQDLNEMEEYIDDLKNELSDYETKRDEIRAIIKAAEEQASKDKDTPGDSPAEEQ